MCKTEIILWFSEDGFCAWCDANLMVCINMTGQGLSWDIEYEKGIRWMPWHQEAMKDVARCEKPRGAAGRR